MQPRCNTAVLQQDWIVLYKGVGEAEKDAFVYALCILEMPNFHKEKPFKLQNGEKHTS